MSDKKKKKKLAHNFWPFEFFYFDESPVFFSVSHLWLYLIRKESFAFYFKVFSFGTKVIDGLALRTDLLKKR